MILVFFLSFILKLTRIVIVGDFNMHIDDVSDKFATDFINITESFNLIQYVTSPTPIRRHTLDLVFSFGLNIGSVLSEDIFYFRS